MTDFGDLRKSISLNHFEIVFKILFISFAEYIKRKISFFLFVYIYMCVCVIKLHIGAKKGSSQNLFGFPYIDAHA